MVTPSLFEPAREFLRRVVIEDINIEFTLMGKADRSCCSMVSKIRGIKRVLFAVPPNTAQERRRREACRSASFLIAPEVPDQLPAIRHRSAAASPTVRSFQLPSTGLRMIGLIARGLLLPSVALNPDLFYHTAL
jgi:hypothetical protein